MATQMIQDWLKEADTKKQILSEAKNAMIRIEKDVREECQRRIAAKNH